MFDTSRQFSRRRFLVGGGMTLAMLAPAVPSWAGGDGSSSTKKPAKRPGATPELIKRDIKKAEMRYLKKQKQIVQLQDKIESLEDANARDTREIEALNKERAENEEFIKLFEKTLKTLERELKLGKFSSGNKMDEVQRGQQKGEIRHVKSQLKPYEDNEKAKKRQVKRLRDKIKKRNAQIKRHKSGINELKKDMKLIDREIAGLKKKLR